LAIASASLSDILSLSNVGIAGGGYLIISTMRAPDILAALGWHTEQCFLYIAAPFDARSAIPGEESKMKTKKKTVLDTTHFVTEELLPCSQNTRPGVRTGTKTSWPTIKSRLPITL
jgi:hypothetical protein